MIRKGGQISEQSVRYVISTVDDEIDGEIECLIKDCVCVTVSGKPVKPKTIGQKNMLILLRIIQLPLV